MASLFQAAKVAIKVIAKQLNMQTRKIEVARLCQMETSRGEK